MRIESLRFLSSGKVSEPERFSLEFGSCHQLEDIRNRGKRPVVYLVRAGDLDHFRKVDENRDLIVDKGTKSRTVELSRLLLGIEDDKIPIVIAEYGEKPKKGKASSQPARSVRTFLKNAHKNGARNMFLIGVSDGVWEGFLEDLKDPKAPGSRKGTTRAKAVRDPTHDEEDEDPGRRVIKELVDNTHVPPEFESEKYLGCSWDARFVRALTVIAAGSNEPVLVIGETGTGKEIVANAIHELSPSRKDKPLVSVNCAAIPENLFESEMFGTRKGAFTGAVEKKGHWEIAHTGTLFLDEIGEIALHHQAKMLRTLEKGEIIRVGAESVTKVDVRVVAATNSDLYSMVQGGKFRADLYQRLIGLSIRTSPLRDHPEDIPLISEKYWHGLTGGDQLPPAILDQLVAYAWPNNVRELKKVLRRLHEMFYLRLGQVTLGHLGATFSMDGQGLDAMSNRPSRTRDGQDLAQCYRHLKGVQEVLHATEVAVRSVVRPRRTADHDESAARTFLKFSFDELRSSAQKTKMFPNEDLFTNIWDLVGRLTFFLGLLEEDEKKAREYWQDTLVDEYGDVAAMLDDELKKMAVSLR